MQEILDLTVEAAKVVVGPLLERRANGRIDSEEECLLVHHGAQYNVPVLMTGWVDVSPQRTTRRLETIAAFRS